MPEYNSSKTQKCLLFLSFSLLARLSSSNTDESLLSKNSNLKVNDQHCSSESCDDVSATSLDCDALFSTKNSEERLLKLKDVMSMDEKTFVDWKSLDSKKMFYIESSGRNHLTARQVKQCQLINYQYNNRKSK